MDANITLENRVERHTSRKNLKKIEKDTIGSIRYYAGNTEMIGKRLAELDKEWDIERYLETNASALAFVGILLGYFVTVGWLALPALVTAFLFQHAIQGWCPPLPIFRRLGKRTRHEIEIEKHALKALRGDYRDVSNPEMAFVSASQNHVKF